MNNWKPYDCPDCGNAVKIENGRTNEAYDCPECGTTLVPTPRKKWKFIGRQGAKQ